MTESEELNEEAHLLALDKELDNASTLLDMLDKRADEFNFKLKQVLQEINSDNVAAQPDTTVDNGIENDFLDNEDGDEEDLTPAEMEARIGQLLKDVKILEANGLLFETQSKN